MKKSFIKMHGLGNDFAVFDARLEGINFTSGQIRHISDRNRGIGCDQLILIEKARSGQSAAYMRIFNPDGGEVGACGNATRCIAQFLMHDLKTANLTIETKAGFLKAAKSGDLVSVDMGEPGLEWQQIPLSLACDTLTVPFGLDAEGLPQPVAVNVGNPHAVFFVENAEAIPVDILGPQVETAPLFPEKTNVEFVHVIDRKTLRMKVWERGVGITQACGTGACASAIASIRKGLTDRKVHVILDGGGLDIEWRESDNHVIMTGAATESFRGEIEL